MTLISKEELIDRMYHQAFEVDSEMQKWDSGCWIRYKLFENILDEVPTIESRPKGKWIEVTNGRGGHECDLCHNYALNWQSGDENLSAYCPFCGAYMKGDSVTE